MSRPTLLYYSEDAGDVYGFWQWVDGRRSEPRAFRVDRAALDHVLTELRAALPTELPGESVADGIERMRTGAFSSPAKERALSSRLSDLLMPPDLVRELLAEATATGSPVLVRMLPAPSHAHVPWELLLLRADGPDGATGTAARRLAEVADVVADPPAGVHAGRARLPEPWSDQVAARPSIHVLDPAPARRRLGLVLSPAQRDAFAARHPDARAVTARTVTRADLSAHLRDDPSPSRLFYVGHVVGLPSHPGTTSLLLSDDDRAYGVLPAVGGNRLFSALDALEGTLFAAQRVTDEDGVVWPTGRREVLGGAQIWPMPPRVALIACASGGDLGHLEPFGLAIAFINAGAEIVTASRWALPTDRAFREKDSFRPDIDPQPLFDMAVAVDDAHATADPVATLAAWQRARIAAWDADDDAPIALSPVTWGALTTFAAPARTTLPLTADETEQLAGIPAA